MYKIAYIGGGSMGWARVFMTDLALEPELEGEVRLFDIDGEAAKLNEIIGNRITADERSLGKWHYVSVPSLGKALEGADFIVISILPGSFEHMRSDVHLPERLGIYQPVGDTTGPGGIIRALRTVPPYVRFAEAIRDYAPDAWVINYTNPMAACVRTLYHVFPDIKAFGCCHEVFGAQALLALMVDREFGEQDIDESAADGRLVGERSTGGRGIGERAADGRVRRSDIKVNVLGVNHFTWFDKASYRDIDLMPLFAKYADELYDVGLLTDFDRHHDKVFCCKNRVKFELFRKYGLIAAAGDRHLAEFMPGDMFLKDPETVEQWGFALTSVDWRIKDREKKVRQTRALASGEEQISMPPSGEEGVLLIKALCGLGDAVSNVNMPNTFGQIEGVPKDTVVETNARFSRNSVVPIASGALTEAVNDLLSVHVDNQAEVLQAALHCDKEAVLRAFGRDPLLRGRCSQAERRALADDMIQNTIDVLPGGWSL